MGYVELVKMATKKASVKIWENDLVTVIAKRNNSTFGKHTWVVEDGVVDAHYEGKLGKVVLMHYYDRNDVEGINNFVEVDFGYDRPYTAVFVCNLKKVSE